MNNIVAIRFKENGKIFFINCEDVMVNEGEYIVCQTERGLELGQILFTNVVNKVNIEETIEIIRSATQRDINTYEQNIKLASKALENAKQIAERLDLNMNLLDASYTLNRAQLLFLFVSDSRVDFREMAKELASNYKTRIELRQIGVRDKAKEISGLGQCGRELCCSSFLKKSMDSVSINMAKNQGLALNPTKINGQCGRLLCCLNYEDELYSENRKDMPNIGDEVKTEKGSGKVVSLDILNKKYMVDVTDEGFVEISL